MLDGVIRLHLGEGFVQITYTKVFILVASFAGMLVLTWIINHTRLGRMCRAVQQDRKMASILGINTDRIISLVFVIGAAMAGLAGVLITMNYGTFDFYVGFVIGIKAFTARYSAASAPSRARCSVALSWAWRKRSSRAW
jgi:branched-chain amino acid transport system permease protein